MNSFDVPSKWILAGEHSVLRGMRAVALPYVERRLTLQYEAADSGLRVDPGEAGDVLDRMLEVLKKRIKRFPTLRGNLRVQSNIPEASGLGSSASVCVAVTRWILAEAGERPDPSRVRDLATELEDLFHGKSSGLDVAVVSANEPIEFKNQKVTLLGVRHLPRFTLHDTGLRASTRECVQKVGRSIEMDSDWGFKLDLQMDEAGTLARQGLEDYDQAWGKDPAGTSKALKKLTKCINMAQECFEAWGLVPPEVKGLLHRLESQGALAAKLTGAGQGGFVVALWN